MASARALAVLLCLAVCGCATTNVRAIRAYAYEDPDFVVALDRIDDIAVVLALLDELMTKTPYAPGDAWVKQLALDDATAEKMKATIRTRPPYDDAEFTIPIVKLYRFHLTNVLRDAKATEREEEADYDSLLDALKDLSGGSLANQWDMYRQATEALVAAEKAYDEERAKYPLQIIDVALPPEVEQAKKRVEAMEARVQFQGMRLGSSIKNIQSADLKRGPRKQIAEDALTAFSVALRIDLEALALIPFAVANMVRSIDDAPAALVSHVTKRKSFAGIEKVSELPRFAEQIEQHLSRQLLLTSPMADALAELTAEDLSDSAGYQLEDSVVDQIAGITLDSFHAQLDVDGEMFFFNQVGGDDTRVETTDSDGNTTGVKDFTGRTQRLTYDVQPIYMLGVRLEAGMDWIKLPNVAGLKFGFATDRVFSRGGNIDNSSSLGEQLGLDGIASDIFDIGLGVLGVRSNVKIATFNFGVVRGLELDPATGDVLGTALEADGDKFVSDFRLKYTQIDVGYDIAFLVSEWARRWYVEEVWLGYRYFNYQLPRILYELEGPPDDLSFVRQSPAQTLSSKYHMGGFRFRFGPGGSPLFHPYAHLSLFFGGGPTAYVFCDNTDVPDATTDCDEERYSGGLGAINGGAALGLRIRLTPKVWPVRAHAGTQYNFEVVSASISQSVAGEDENRSIDLGSSEFFHGPQFHLHGEL